MIVLFFRIFNSTFPYEHRPGYVPFTFNVWAIRLSVHRSEARTSVADWTEFGHQSASTFRIDCIYHGLMVFMVPSVLRGASSHRDMKEFCASLVSGAPEGQCCCLHPMSGQLNDLLFTKMNCCGLHRPLIPPGIGRHDWTLVEAKTW